MSNNIWFTGDTHFGHANVIKHCNRPFKSADEMDETMIRNWNDRVSEHDSVYHLGDFSFSKGPKTREILDRLNGHIYLIRGNHDGDQVVKVCADKFVWIKDYFELKVDNQKMILCHYPF